MCVFPFLPAREMPLAHTGILTWSESLKSGYDLILFYTGELHRVTQYINKYIIFAWCISYRMNYNRDLAACVHMI